MEFIGNIIRTNFLLQQEKVYIRSSYLDIFFDSGQLQNVSVVHKGRGYFQLDLIPKKLLDKAQIPESGLIYQELYKINPSIKNPYVERYLKSLKNTFLDVIRDCSPFMQTYSDYKLDSQAMKRKALTHAIMHFAGPFLKKFPDRYDAVFLILKELNPDVELPLGSLRKFYFRADEIIRAGLPHALIKDLPTPLNTS